MCYNILQTDLEMLYEICYVVSGALFVDACPRIDHDRALLFAPEKKR